MIRGLVQGVGFRPFIYRLACRYGLLGKVENRTDGVSVIVQGNLKTIDRFSNDILESAPPASRIKSIEVNPRMIEEFDSFRIVRSRTGEEITTEVSPDIAVCDECLEDLEKDTERINYPLVNCTNCGPRFSIIRAIPYDRINTSMAGFPMCEKCESQYRDISNRRFHAQPVACNSCGPQYFYSDYETRISGIEKIMARVADLISAGKSVALKGTGGYHLICDAFNNAAVSELRKRKRRDSKPFAVMFRNISSLRKYCHTCKAEEEQLLSWQRPIVILGQKRPLAGAVSQGLNTIGALLPYMPFHYMIFKYLKTGAVVLTSGNLSDDPVITSDDVAEKYLLPVADGLVGYDREIINRSDDSVMRLIDNKMRLIRRSRGFVPGPVDTSLTIDGIFATGAEQKNTFCIGKGSQAIMSQHIGDLKNFVTYAFFTESAERFGELFSFTPRYVACDLHPLYLSTLFAEQLAEERNIPLVKVQHHHAHIASCMAENRIDEKVIGISLDGTGYGSDGNIWGGEFFVADLHGFERFAHFDYVPLPGGDRAVAEPWRTACSYLWKYFGDSIDYNSIPLFRKIENSDLTLVLEMLCKNINTPLSSGAGRLFDAVAALAGLCTVASFDSEPPMRLESAVKKGVNLEYPFSVSEVISFTGMFDEILKDIKKGETDMIPVKFHNTIAQLILELSEKMQNETGLKKVIMSGGVFQNRYLLERSSRLLRKAGFDVFTHHIIPSNDGGISVGQMAVASKTIGLCV